MDIKIDGYFDCNFGDDYMIKTVLEHFSEMSFVIEEKKGISPMLKEIKNISFEKKECDKNLRIIGSGFMVNSPAAFITELIWLLKGKKEPNWCIGCNIEPFKNALYKAIITKKLKKYELISCRDKKSYEWIKENCKGVRVHYFPDILFSALIEKAEGGSSLGVSVMNLGLGGKYEGYYKALAQVADYYIDTKKGQVFLCAFDTGEENDTAACEYVKSLMKSQGVQIVKHGSADEIIRAFAQCKKIIGTRFHSIVLALKMRLEVYPVIFREKTRSLLEDVNYPMEGSCVENLEAKELIEFIDAEPLDFCVDGEYEKSSKGHMLMLEEFLKD